MIRRPPRSTRVRSSAASDVYKRQILYNGHVTVQKGKITVNGTALIEQVLWYPVNGSVTVVHDGGEVKSCICDNTLVIYAQNTTIYSVT